MSNIPTWFKDNKVLIINAPTCGINKDGVEQYIVNSETGERTQEIDDKTYDSVASVLEGKDSVYSSYIDIDDVLGSKIIVPSYYNNSYLDDVKSFFLNKKDFRLVKIGDLLDSKEIKISKGHGSPSLDRRVGSIPYIKVSDLRAGQININPSNLVPSDVAREYWRGESSKLKPYDLICPERASKNIGEFCVLLPGQEKIVLTKEVLILRAGNKSILNQFYLMWAMSLDVVRQQWNRVIFMQTNREDVGKRYCEIEIPFPESANIVDQVSAPFKTYFEGVNELKHNFRKSISNSIFRHHFYV